MPLRRARLVVAALLIGGSILVTGPVAIAEAQPGLVFGPVPAMAAEPTATPGPGGDPRSPGEGPGFVGDPLLAIGAVVLVGVGSVLVTLAYVRLTGRRLS